MGYIGNQPFLGTVTGDNVVDGSITAQDLAPGAAVPSQTGNAGKFLTTDGTNASWDTVSEVPTQTGETGKFLTTNGTTASWAVVDVLPSQTGQTGKYLTTNGTNTSWGALSSVRVTGATYPGDDTAVAPAGGQTVTLAGTGFVSTPTVFVNNTIAPSVSFVSSTQITFVTPAFAAGTYHVYVVNPDGATAIFVNGISYSGVPTWTTAAGSLGTYDGALSVQLQATSDSAVTYALTSGSTLPAGITLSSSGLISGTSNTEQTFSFSVDAIDAQNQDTPRSFSVTISLAEPFFKSNVLLLSGNGTNGAQNNTFLDSSTNNFTITRNGNTTQGSFSPFSQTGWSNYFNGSTDELTTSTSVLSGVGSNNFSIECFVYALRQTNTYAQALVSYGISGQIYTTSILSFDINVSGYLQLAFADGSVAALTSSSLVPINQWVHVVVCRSGSTISLFMNGIRVATGTTSVTLGSGGNRMVVGGQWYAAEAARRLQGYLSNVRVVTGTSAYDATQSTLTVPTAPLTAISGTSLLTCQSNRFRDASTNNFAITVTGSPSVQPFSPFNPTTAYSASSIGGSGYFDGSGDYLQSSITALSGQFTVEFWVYRPATGNNFLFTIGDSSASSGAEIYIGSSGNQLNYYSNNAVRINGGTPPPAGQWNYFAVTRDASNDVRLYANGVQVGSSYNQSGTLSTDLRVGAEYYGGSITGTLNGYMGAFRVSNTVRTVTSVPTSLWESDANTIFLANFTNAGIYDATSKNDLETVGNAQISTTQSKFGGSSMYFDGDGDYLSLPPRQTLALGSGDWTVEAWVYLTAAPVEFTALFCSWNYYTSGYNGNFIGRVSTSNLWTSFNGQGDQIAINGTYTWTLNAWTHIAWVRFGNTVTVYRNGLSIGTVTDTKNLSDSANGLIIGVNRTNGTIGGGSPTQYITGYVNDFRATPGIARYTSNFTPPTTAFLTL